MTRLEFALGLCAVLGIGGAYTHVKTDQVVERLVNLLDSLETVVERLEKSPIVQQRQEQHIHVPESAEQFRMRSIELQKRENLARATAIQNGEN